MRTHIFTLFFACIIYTGCKQDKLPVLGFREIINGQTEIAKTPGFSYANQFGVIIDSTYLQGKIHVANFFFTSCPTICPKTIKSMKRLSDHFGADPSIQFLNFSIDFRTDSIPRLKHYFDKLEITNSNFHLLRMPDKSELSRVPPKYMSVALEDSSASGGFDHSGWLLLVDKERHIRSYCLGTDEKDVNRFIKDIERLKGE